VHCILPLSKSIVDTKSDYVMVLQYADGGNLRDYLRHPPSPLTWSDKYRIALEIAEGLLCLHAESILHRDLVSLLYNFYIDNIIVFDKNNQLNFYFFLKKYINII
jgi:serine/threonine protein kinase